MSGWRGALRACALLLLCAACAHAQSAPGKRAESELLSPMPFVLGSRYGRSQPRLIAPRNDRFFMGSRYGKRSEPLPPPPRPAPPSPHLYCEPTGLLQLYRCSPHFADVRRLEDEREPSFNIDE